MTDLARLLDAFASLERLAPAGARLAGVGWATVDTERTLDALAGAPAGASSTTEPALGATAAVIQAGSVALVVLEPDTEGRLAAALARRGEGIACLYLEADAPTGSSRPTALGRPGRLLPHDRPWGPFVILVDPA
ncbi:MAG: hypothetical protein U0869_12985 [Chloroflexota bacterium]